MNKNPIEVLREELNKKGQLNLEFQKILAECELSSRENIRNYYLNEHIEDELYLNIDNSKSIFNGKNKTIKQFNLNALNTLNYLNKNELKQDIIFIDFSQENYVIKGKKLNKKTPKNFETWLGFITNRIKEITKLISDRCLLFIAVDDTIVSESRLIADKYIGKSNYVSTIIFDTPDISPHIKFLNETKEYVLVYKGKDIQELNKNKINEQSEEKYNKLDRTRKYRADYDYKIKVPNTEECAYAGGSKEDWENRQKGVFNEHDWKWMLTEKEFNKRLADGFIKFTKEDGVWKVYNKYNTSKEVPFSDRISGDSYIKGKNELEKYIGKISKRKNKPISYYNYLINLHPLEDTKLNILNLNGEDGSLEEAVLSSVDSFSLITVNDLEQNSYKNLNVVKERIDILIENGSLVFDKPSLIQGFDFEFIEFSKDKIKNDFTNIKTLEDVKIEKILSENTTLIYSEYTDVFIIETYNEKEFEIVYNESNPEKETIIYLTEKSPNILKNFLMFGMDNIKFL